MRKIRIISTPPGELAPKYIRKQWVGVEIPLASKQEILIAAQQSGVTPSSVKGYIVRGDQAVGALLEAGRIEAATYWATPMIPRYLKFDLSCCEEIS